MKGKGEGLQLFQAWQEEIFSCLCNPLQRSGWASRPLIKPYFVLDLTLTDTEGLLESLQTLPSISIRGCLLEDAEERVQRKPGFPVRRRHGDDVEGALGRGRSPGFKFQLCSLLSGLLRRATACLGLSCLSCNSKMWLGSII